ncbi:transporter substrate-binding domain-containing protein [Pseudodesulfovibrio sp. zrk46]|uniref:substrate-binding periplasmic protein n=1 Tax=Pseudodesulfovibrio sp. zrk46 TaxID=2725288 RepID=UPI001449640A|nr:transporter substrate-binding domain-containing protein [Pseudodesulfovibrio sp. zrk46]QJB56349.1 transporter substrate-binding domain-containing protein [Pseudodesulfovibrio sp. zrk46]
MNLIESRIFAGVFIYIALLFPASAWAQSELPLPIVFEDYPPYEFVEDGEVKGMNIEIIREAFSRMGIKPYFEPRPWKRALFQLLEGEILALSSGFQTKDREEFVAYPSGGGLGMEINCVIIPADSDLKITSLDDLRGLRVGVVRSYVYGGGFDEIEGLNKIEAGSTHQLLRMLLKRRMDVAIGNKMVFRYLALKREQESSLQFPLEIAREPLHLMFSKAYGPRGIQMARDFGVALEQMKKDGTFDAIVSRY